MKGSGSGGQRLLTDLNCPELSNVTGYGLRVEICTVLLMKVCAQIARQIGIQISHSQIVQILACVCTMINVGIRVFLLVWGVHIVLNIGSAFYSCCPQISIPATNARVDLWVTHATLILSLWLGNSGFGSAGLVLTKLVFELAVQYHIILSTDSVFWLKFALESCSAIRIVFGSMRTIMDANRLMRLGIASNNILPSRIYLESNLWSNISASYGGAASGSWTSSCCSQKRFLRLLVHQMVIFTSCTRDLLSRSEILLVC